MTVLGAVKALAPVGALAGSLISAAPQGAAVAADSLFVESRSFTLDNGVRVILAPGGDGRNASVAMLFSIGELHDPPGRNGMARLCEQLYCTAAAGRVAARSAEDIRRRYPAGTIDQAFSDHSVIGFVIPRDRLEFELAEAAERLRGVRLDAADLDRERARMQQRIRAWDADRPGFAAIFDAMAPISPLPDGARIGGDIDQMSGATLEEVRDRLDRFYKPANATLAIAGAFDADSIERVVRERFGSIPAGERIASASARPAPDPPSTPTRRTLAVPQGAAPERHAAVAVRPPPPSSPDSVAFAVLVARLIELEERDGFLADPSAPGMQAYQLDPNSAFVIRRACGSASSPEAVLAAIIERLQGAAEMTPEEFSVLKQRLQGGDAWMTGESAIPLRILKRNPYGVAYALARQAQLGVDPRSRAAQLEALDLGMLFEAAARIFARERLSQAIVVTEPAGAASRTPSAPAPFP